MKKARIQQKADFARRGKINSCNMAKKSEDVAVFYLGQEGRGDAGIVLFWMNIPTVPWKEKEKLCALPFLTLIKVCPQFLVCSCLCLFLSWVVFIVTVHNLLFRLPLAKIL
jgi:hypothetical protein